MYSSGLLGLSKTALFGASVTTTTKFAARVIQWRDPSESTNWGASV
jgi:hypothetical protein